MVNRTLITLDTRRLSDTDAAAWLDLLSFAVEGAGHPRTARVVLCGRETRQPTTVSDRDSRSALAVECAPDAAVPDTDEPFVFLTGSEVLSSRLLRRFDRLHIEPAGPPQGLEPRLYWAARSRGRFSGVPSASRRISLITSVFDADTYLQGFLANSAALHGYRECEHFLVRPGSPGDEHAALLAHVRDWPGAVYINLSEDPGLYEVWNLCTRLASAPYLSNANVDDRRAPRHVETLARRLDDDSGIDVVYSALRVTQTRNLPWSESADCPVWFSDGGDRTYTAEELFRRDRRGVRDRNRPHCMPVWRRELHAFHGGFREREWGPSADWEFWLRVGTAGARFAQVAEPLGLYLRDAASYWQRGSAGAGFNDRIVARYAPHFLENEAVPAETRPLGLLFADIQEHARCGAWLELVMGVLQCARRVAGSPGEATAVQLVDRLGRYFFGVEGLAKRIADDPRGVFADLADLDCVLSALIELLHCVDGATLLAETALAQRVLFGALVDHYELSSDGRALLGCALLMRWQGDAEAEGRFLETVHKAEGTRFWRLLQQVYRFSVPLTEIARRLAVVDVCGETDRRSLGQLNLTYFPEFRGNPYQSLLYQSVTKAGGIARPLSHLDELEALDVAPDANNVLHIHWLKGVFRRIGARDFAAHACKVLDQLRRAQRRGFWVYWTVHNELNHETVAPELERRFRNLLARRVDRVYVHHPMIPALLDWFPSERRPWLVEHGPFPGAVRTSQVCRDARDTLGLPRDALLLVNTGQVRDYKALDRYVPVLNEFLRQSERGHLAVVGRFASSAAREALATLPASQVTLRDEEVADDELETWLRAADFAFLSYRAILTSGSLFHALSLGVPVIAPNLGTIPAYVNHGWNGFLYNDELELASVLRHCSALSAAAVEALGHNAAATTHQLRWDFC